MFDEPGFERPAEPDDPDLPLIYHVVYCSRADAGVDEAEVDRIVASSQRGIRGQYIYLCAAVIAGAPRRVIFNL